MFGSALYQAFRAVKHAFDPNGVFNPGKIVDCAAADAPTCATARATGRRIRPRSSTIPNTAASAARSRCAAASGRAARRSKGRCVRRAWRRVTSETSTRGRANTLRLAMTGRLAEAGLDDEGVLETCSTSVSSVARARRNVPSAWTSRGSRASSWPSTGASTGCRSASACSATCARSRRSGASSRRCRTGSRASGIGRWMNEKMFGIDRRRTPPAWAKRNVCGEVLEGPPEGGPHRCGKAAPTPRAVGAGFSRPPRFSSTTPLRTSTSLRLASPRSACSRRPEWACACCRTTAAAGR